jgi:hypothetical protein
MDSGARMKKHFVYCCEYGHTWTTATDGNEPEDSAGRVCEEGHDYITCRIELPVDDVQILVSPAARVIDKCTGQKTLNGHYYLSLLDRDGNVICTTRDHHEWEKMLSFVSFFRDKSVESALSWWKKRDL